MHMRTTSPADLKPTEIIPRLASGYWKPTEKWISYRVPQACPYLHFGKHWGNMLIHRHARSLATCKPDPSLFPARTSLNHLGKEEADWISENTDSPFNANFSVSQMRRQEIAKLTWVQFHRNPNTTVRTHFMTLPPSALLNALITVPSLKHTMKSIKDAGINKYRERNCICRKTITHWIYLKKSLLQR